MSWIRLFLLISIPLIAGAHAPGQQAEWRRVAENPSLVFPRDHGAHYDYQTEWWYVTGEAKDASGREFGWQFTIFRRGLNPEPVDSRESSLRPRHAFAGHFAIADIKNKKFIHTDRLRRSGLGLASASDSDMNLVLEDWSMVRSGAGGIRIIATDTANKARIDLSLSPSRPPILHGKNGYSQKGPEPGNASAYVSFTRLATKGTIGVDGVDFDVSGESWFDHEFGTSQLGGGANGWDWFGLRLDDGRELMLYGLRRAQGDYLAYSGGTIVYQDGRSRSLASGDFTMEAAAFWTSPRTKAVYPSQWKLRVPSEKIEISVQSMLDDAELETGGTTAITYWEGPVRVSGSVTGRGYMELTGYAGSVAGKL